MFSFIFPKNHPYWASITYAGHFTEQGEDSSISPDFVLPHSGKFVADAIRVVPWSTALQPLWKPQSLWGLCMCITRNRPVSFSKVDAGGKLPFSSPSAPPFHSLRQGLFCFQLRKTHSSSNTQTLHLLIPNSFKFMRYTDKQESSLPLRKT